VINSLKDNTYYAQVFLKSGEELISIDARPSDSIALALRLKAPIFASETLLNEVGKVDEDGELEESEDGEPEPYDPEKLKDHLRNMNPEDFGKFTLGD
jgi:bifunctional DNase/RNase